MNTPSCFSLSKFFKENQILILLAGVKLLLHFGVTLRDHIFRDELYYIACGRHLDFGYVDHPPFIAVMAFLSQQLLGESLFALRIFSTISGALLVFFTGILVRQLRGSRFAQGFAALCVLCVPYNLGIDGFFSMNAFDLLFWLLGAMTLVRLLQNEEPSMWLGFGLVMGIGLMNKLSMLFFGVGLAVGVLLTPQHRWFLNRWFWISGVTAFMIFLPHILWQIINGWPTLEFIDRARTYKNLPLSSMQFMHAQLIGVHPFLLPVWLLGLWWYFFTRDGKPYRILGWIFIVVTGILIVDKEKAYYLAPAFSMLMAAGAMMLDKGFQWLNWMPLKPVLCGIIAVGGIVILPLTPIFAEAILP